MRSLTACVAKRYAESEDFNKGLSMFSESRDDFDTWFKERLAEATGVDLKPEMELPELVSRTQGRENAAGDHSTDYLASLGTGAWRHVTPSGERFDARFHHFGCHSNADEVADLEGTGSFRGSDVVLTLQVRIEDLERFASPDWYSMAIFNGSTLVYGTAGNVVSGDFTVEVAS